MSSPTICNYGSVGYRIKYWLIHWFKSFGYSIVDNYYGIQSQFIIFHNLWLKIQHSVSGIRIFENKMSVNLCRFGAIALSSLSCISILCFSLKTFSTRSIIFDAACMTSLLSSGELWHNQIVFRTVWVISNMNASIS